MLISFCIFLFSFKNQTFAQDDSMVQNYSPEPLWYLQKETWFAGAILIAIIIVGILYRIGRVKKIITTKTVILNDDKFKDEANKPL